MQYLASGLAIAFLLVCAGFGWWLGKTAPQRAMKRQAEAALYEEMNWQRATQAAADKILRKSGEQP